MLNLALEPTDELADPLFKDAKSCARWLEQLQLTNLQLAHSLLLTQINELNRFPMREQERQSTLETLRDTVHYVQGEYAKKLIAKPLPLDESELIIFLSIVQLWQAMSLGYQRCLQSSLEGGEHVGKKSAFFCQRSLLYSGLAICERLRTGYEFDTDLWRQLHGLFAFAEKQGLQLEGISDPLNGNLPRSSCHDIYVKTLLTCYARPAELTRSQLLLLDLWLAEWSNMVPIEHSYIIDKDGAQPLALDLDGTSGPQPAKLIKHSESMRYLMTAPLSKLLRVKTILLQQGQTPKKVKLAGKGSAQDCIELLTHLHRCWCEDNSTRFGARNPDSQTTRLCHDPEIIHALLSGKGYRQNAKSSAASRIARKQLEAFGQALQEGQGKSRDRAASAPETWQFENESILGARLTRVDTNGGRLGHNQLVALRPGEKDDFKLGVTIWVSVTRTGQLQIGVRYLPGTVHAIQLGMPDASPESPGMSASGFFLQAVPALKTPASLIIPRNWFKPGKLLVIRQQNGEKQNAKMGISVERGIDYERISFTLGTSD